MACVKTKKLMQASVWNQTAEFDLRKRGIEVVGLRNFRMVTFGHVVCLSMHREAEMVFDPKIEETYEIKSWYHGLTEEEKSQLTV